MGFRINNNVTALIAQGNLQKTQNSLTRSIERLSSGLRINRGADDAAGLTISEKLRGQIKGLNRAILNAQDGISLIQTAEGALNENAAILNRIRELTIQASSDTLTTNDRLEIQKEVDQLIDEVDRIANTTEFNTKKLLDGTASSIVTVNEEGLDGIQVGSTKNSAGDYSVELYMASMGINQEMASNIMTSSETSELVTQDTKLGDIESFFDNSGNNVLRNPQEFTIRGNSSSSKITLSSDVSIGELVDMMKETITKDIKKGGLGIKGTDVSFDSSTGQILIKSGQQGSNGDIAFSSDENLIKAFGFQETVPSKDPAYRAQAVQQGVADPITSTSSTTTNRFTGIIPGVDLQFQPPTAAMIEGSLSPTEVIRIGDTDVTFSFADTNSDLTENNGATHYVEVTLSANTTYSQVSIQNIINENIRFGIDKVTGTSFYDATNYPGGYQAPNLRADFRGGNLVISSGVGGSSSKVSIFNVSASGTNILGLQNGVFYGENGISARLIGNKDVSDGLNIGTTDLAFEIIGPDGKTSGAAGNNRIQFAANSNVSTTSLTTVINNQLRATNIRAEATIDANGRLLITSLEDGEDTAIVLNQLTGNLSDVGYVDGAAASGKGGRSAEFIGKTNDAFSELGYTFDTTTAFEVTDQYGATSGDIVFGADGRTGTAIATNNNITLSSTSISQILDSSDINTTDVGYEFDNGGRLRFFSKSVGKSARILMTSKNPTTVLGGGPATFTAATSATSLLSTFGIEGSQAVLGTGQTKFDVHISDRSFTLQIGANENQVLESSIANFSSEALGLTGLDVTSLASARKALAAVDRAVNRVSSERSKLGSLQNRLTSTINNLTVTATNLQAAESRIRDVDVAQETVQFTRNQILIQAGTAQLAQANALPQQALQLLGG
jgi:flagellin